MDPETTKGSVNMELRIPIEIVINVRAEQKKEKVTLYEALDKLEESTGTRTTMTSMMTPEMTTSMTAISKAEKPKRHYKKRKKGVKKEKRKYKPRVPSEKVTNVDLALEKARVEQISFVRAYRELYGHGPSREQQDSADRKRGKKIEHPVTCECGKKKGHSGRCRGAFHDRTQDERERLEKDNEYMQQHAIPDENRNQWPCGICLTPNSVESKGEICGDCRAKIDEKNRADDNITSKKRGPRGPYKKRKK